MKKLQDECWSWYLVQATRFSVYWRLMVCSLYETKSSTLAENQSIDQFCSPSMGWKRGKKRKKNKMAKPLLGSWTDREKASHQRFRKISTCLSRRFLFYFLSSPLPFPPLLFIDSKTKTKKIGCLREKAPWAQPQGQGQQVPPHSHRVQDSPLVSLLQDCWCFTSYLEIVRFPSACLLLTLLPGI